MIICSANDVQLYISTEPIPTHCLTEIKSLVPYEYHWTLEAVIKTTHDFSSTIHSSTHLPTYLQPWSAFLQQPLLNLITKTTLLHLKKALSSPSLLLKL